MFFFPRPKGPQDIASTSSREEVRHVRSANHRVRPSSTIWAVATIYPKIDDEFSDDIRAFHHELRDILVDIAWSMMVDDEWMGFNNNSARILGDDSLIFFEHWSPGGDFAEKKRFKTLICSAGSMGESHRDMTRQLVFFCHRCGGAEWDTNLPTSDKTLLLLLLLLLFLAFGVWKMG